MTLNEIAYNILNLVRGGRSSNNEHISTSQITVDVKLNAGTMVFLAKGIPIPASSSFEYMAGNKIVLESGHSLIVKSATANSLDTVASIMEIT